MTTAPCKYCGNDHGPVGGVVCAYTAPFARLAAGKHSSAPQFFRVQQYFALDVDFTWDGWAPDAAHRNLTATENFLNMMRTTFLERCDMGDYMRQLKKRISNNTYGKSNQPPIGQHRPSRRPLGRA